MQIATAVVADELVTEKKRERESFWWINIAVIYYDLLVLVLRRNSQWSCS